MISVQVFSVASFAWALVALGQVAPGADSPAAASKNRASVPTFHCLSIYWSPENGQAGKKVLVKFREAAEKTWHDGLPMRYNPRKNA